MPYKAGRCRLGVILKARRIKVVEFAEQINMSPSQLTDYIHGRKATMSLNTAMTIASALSVHIEQLYEWDYVSPSQRKRKKQE
ncbi:helix-turn-helix domain-containing protein [Brevibacillus centrosporus]|uniref:helix-turn-helix domain-containing protein n=1 Tax=Brevibacillus centrosporus TaxID=54910 RepID=UPI00399CD48A